MKYTMQEFQYDADEQTVVNRPLMLERPEVTHDMVRNGLDDIAGTRAVIRLSKYDPPFEIAIVNPKAPRDQGVDVRLSTFTSSLTNLGNAVEFAENGALYPNRPQVYVASLGNGGSSYLDFKERKHLRKTGRLTHEEDGKTVAVPTVQLLARTLLEHELVPTRVSADSAGAVLDTALMTALQPETVTHAYFKGRTNLAHMSLARLAFGMLVTENFVNGPRNMRTSNDPMKLTSELVELAKERLVPLALPEDMAKFLPNHSIVKLFTDVQGFRRGPKNEQSGPAVYDTAAALAYQAGALITYHCSKGDVLYKGHAEQAAVRFLTQLARTVPEATLKQSPVSIKVVPGTHGDHAANPGLRWAVEWDAFARGLIF